jgi:hypothetical protein
MYIYNQLNYHFIEGNNESSWDQLGNPPGSSKDILCKAKGDHLDQLLSNQKVLKVIRRGRLVLVFGCQDSQN